MSSQRLIRVAAFASGVLSIVLVGAALLGDHGVLRHEKLREELNHAKSLNDHLESENRRLRAEAESLRSDPEYVESVIRDELGFVRKDELIFLFKEKAK